MCPAGFAVLLGLLLPAAPARAQAEGAWPVNETAHFVIHHEKPGAALGDYSRIEQIYESLHAELWSLTPWMATEKTHIYIYKDADSYHRGKFNPPAWSGGLLQTADGQKTLAVFEPVDTGIVAHELTHLYFHSYFDEKNAPPPPSWLDEGLASMMQYQGLSRPDPRLKGPILAGTIPLAQFVRTRPAQDAPAVWVGGWYQEAQSVAWFLKRGHIDSSFTDFCGKLRDGQDVEIALRQVYGYDDLAAFDADWQKWRPTKPVGMLKGIGDR
jgi:hypothetical protein